MFSGIYRKLELNKIPLPVPSKLHCCIPATDDEEDIYFNFGREAGSFIFGRSLSCSCVTSRRKKTRASDGIDCFYY